MLEWAQKLAIFHNKKLRGRKIELAVIPHGSSDLTVKMNKGKLTQICDNLILNAEYWLREAIRADSLEIGRITITIDAPVVQIKDNGRGIDKSVEESLFDPFVTTKRVGEGRGLGLFVVRQLLDSESCSIILLPDRNTYGRRYIFELDLSGVVSE